MVVVHSVFIEDKVGSFPKKSNGPRMFSKGFCLFVLQLNVRNNTFLPSLNFSNKAFFIKVVTVY